MLQLPVFLYLFIVSERAVKSLTARRHDVAFRCIQERAQLVTFAEEMVLCAVQQGDTAHPYLGNFNNDSLAFFRDGFNSNLGGITASEGQQFPFERI